MITDLDEFADVQKKTPVDSVSGSVSENQVSPKQKGKPSLVLDESILNGLNSSLDDIEFDSVNTAEVDSIDDNLLKDDLLDGEPIVAEESASQTVESSESLPAATTESLPASYSSESLMETAESLIETAETFGNKAYVWGKKFFTKCISHYQDSTLYKRFERGDLVQTNNMQFLLEGNELMVFKYTGNEEYVVIPDYVGGVPVKYLYKGFLSKNLVNNYRVRSFFSLFKEDKVLDLSLDRIKQTASGIKGLQLPCGLLHIPAQAFSGCPSLEFLEIPSSVEVLSPHSFTMSNITRLVFSGKAPKHIAQLKLNKGMSVYCKPEHVASFNPLLQRLQKEKDKVLAQQKELESIREEVKDELEGRR